MFATSSEIGSYSSSGTSSSGTYRQESIRFGQLGLISERLTGIVTSAIALRNQYRNWDVVNARTSSMVCSVQKWYSTSSSPPGGMRFLHDPSTMEVSSEMNRSQNKRIRARSGLQ